MFSIDKNTANQMQASSGPKKSSEYNSSFKEFRKIKKDQLKQAREQAKRAREQAENKREQLKDQLNQLEKTIKNNTDSNLKAKGIARLKGLIDAQIQKIETIIIPNLILLLRNEIEQYIIENAYPSTQVIEKTLSTINNIIKDINSVAEKIDKVAQILQITSGVINSVQGLSFILQATIPSVSLVAKSQPLIPGFVVSLLDDLDYINNKLLYKANGEPKLPPTIAGISSVTLGISIASVFIRNAIELITPITLLLQRCIKENSLNLPPIESISDISKQYSEYGNSNYNTFEKTSYQGFDIRIEEVPFNANIVRRRAVGYSPYGTPLIRTELSFTSNAQTLVNELKLIIDRDNLKAY
jgi:hypothetical protein